MDAKILLATTIRQIHDRGWADATAGNYSATLGRSPLRLLMSPSGVDKGEVSPDDLIEVDEEGQKTGGNGKPSAETLLHVVVNQEREVGAVLHTHSTWNTVLSRRFLASGGLNLTGFEILKALPGVKTHEHTEFLPILANSQDMRALAEEVREVLRKYPNANGFLLAGHGLYTWGRDLTNARHHVEAFEFLLEVVGTEQLLG